MPDACPTPTRSAMQSHQVSGLTPIAVLKPPGPPILTQAFTPTYICAPGDQLPDFAALLQAALLVLENGNTDDLRAVHDFLHVIPRDVLYPLCGAFFSDASAFRCVANCYEKCNATVDSHRTMQALLMIAAANLRDRAEGRQPPFTAGHAFHAEPLDSKATRAVQLCLIRAGLYDAQDLLMSRMIEALGVRRKNALLPVYAPVDLPFPPMACHYPRQFC